jgi:hypothetical protein
MTLPRVEKARFIDIKKRRPRFFQHRGVTGKEINN